MDLLIVIAFGVWAAFAVLGFWRPGFTLVLIISLSMIELVYASRFPSAYLSNRQLVDLLTGSMTLAVVVLRSSLSISRFSKPQIVGVFLFFLCGFSVLWSVAPGNTIAFWIFSAPKVLLFSVLAPLCIEKKRDLEDFIKGFIAFGFLLCITYLSAAKEGRGVMLDTGFGAAELGPLTASHFAGIFSILCVFSIFRTKRHIAVRLVFGLGVCVGIFVIASTSSRGQLIALAPICLLLLPYVISQNNFSLKAIASVVFGFSLCCIAFVIIQIFQFDSRWREQNIETGYNQRSSMVSDLLSAYADGGFMVWVLGLGSSSSYDLVGFYCHVQVVEILAELGLLGLSVYLWYHVCLYQKAKYALRDCVDIDSRLTLGTFLGMALYAVLLSQKEGAFIHGTALGYANCAFAAISQFKLIRIERANAFRGKSTKLVDQSIGGQFQQGR